MDGKEYRIEANPGHTKRSQEYSAGRDRVFHAFLLAYDGATIHRNYNKWVRNLEILINRQLGSL